MTNKVEKYFLNVSEAADLIGCHTNTIRKHIRAGSLPAYQVIGQQYRIDKDELIEWVRQHKMPAAATE